MTRLLLIALCIGYATAQRFVPGYCPSPTPHENFDKSKFFGHWIEAEKTPSMFDMMMRCQEVDYSDDNDGSINVVVRGQSFANLPITVNGDGLVQDVTKHGHYSIRYGFGVPFQGTLTTILDTDYKEFAVVYSCTNSLLSGVFHSEYIWILSRDGTLSNPTRQNIYEKLDELKINRSGLQLSDRNGCPSNATLVHREEDGDLAKPGTLSSTEAPVPAIPGAAAIAAIMTSSEAAPVVVLSSTTTTTVAPSSAAPVIPIVVKLMH